MKLLHIIQNKITWILRDRYVKKQKEHLQSIITNRTNPRRIYFFCTPTHSNLGDQAQFFCWIRLLKKWYPDYEIVCIPTKYRQFQTIRSIRKNLTDEDLIYIHSGYLIFGPHPELPFILDIVRAFYDHQITILPQTVNLVDEWFKQIVSRAFNAHSNLTLMCRDEVSLKNAKSLFPSANLLLMPDVVTSLIGDKDFQYEKNRKGIMLCLRNDGERFYNTEQINRLKEKFKDKKVSVCDTTIKVNIWEWDKKREKLIRNILEEFASYQVIITDRYHGTIFSQIVNTPVIVISSTDHKLSSGVKWFPKNEFGENITFAQNLDEAYNRAMDILKRNGKVIKNPSWFKSHYYSTKL